MARYLWLLALPGGSIVVALLAVALFLRRQNRRSSVMSVEEERDLIKPPVQLHGKLSPAESEALRLIAERRRDHAHAKRLEAAQIESGARNPERMRLVR